jgi:capsular polysaccharide transport system permease protein
MPYNPLLWSHWKMPDSDKDLIPQSETERIEAWRAERARVAEGSKAHRLKEKEDTKIAEQTALVQKQSSKVKELLAKSEWQDQGQTQREKSTKNLQFLLLVVLPIVLTGFYLFAVATPLYEAKSVVAITRSVDAGEGRNSGLLGGFQGPSNLPDMFRAHAFIGSRAMMDALEAQSGLVTRLSSREIDPIRRLRTIPVLAVTKQAQFDRFVSSAVDIQSGLLSLYVRAPDKQSALDISNDLLTNSAEQVNSLGRSVFAERQALADYTLTIAQEQMTAAQQALLRLQIKHQESDPRNRIEQIYGTIRSLESEAQSLDNQVRRAEISGIGQSDQTLQTAALRDGLRQQVAIERQRLVADSVDGGISLNNLLMKYELAQLDVDLAKETVTSAITAKAQTGQAATLNRSLFQIVVPPRVSEAPLHPNNPMLLLFVTVLSLALFFLVRVIYPGRN